MPFRTTTPSAWCATDWNVKLTHGMDLGRHDDESRHFWRALIATLVLAPGTADCRSSGQDYGTPPRSNATCTRTCRRALRRFSSLCRYRRCWASYRSFTAAAVRCSRRGSRWLRRGEDERGRLRAKGEMAISMASNSLVLARAVFSSAVDALVHSLGQEFMYHL